MMVVAGGEVQSGLILNFAVSLATKSARRRRIDQGSGGKDEMRKVRRVVRQLKLEV